MPRLSYESQRDIIVAQVPEGGIPHEELVRRLEVEGHAALVREIAAVVQRGDLRAEVIATGPDTPAQLRYSRPDKE